jgi:hypothetical protein
MRTIRQATAFLLVRGCQNLASAIQTLNTSRTYEECGCNISARPFASAKCSRDFEGEQRKDSLVSRVDDARSSTGSTKTAAFEKGGARIEEIGASRLQAGLSCLSERAASTVAGISTGGCDLACQEFMKVMIVNSAMPRVGPKNIMKRQK